MEQGYDRSSHLHSRAVSSLAVARKDRVAADLPSMTIPVFMLMLRALSSRTLAHAWISPLWLDS